uniref:Uncharacterized protein n=1 Tax=Hyaloperonospora arabidopsidis (strain Emoy2) TaxID=559515 RepID=M4BG91_HYAAE
MGNDNGTAGLIVGDTYTRISDQETGNTTTGMPVNRTTADSAVENEMYNASKAGKSGIPQLESETLYLPL